MIDEMIESIRLKLRQEIGNNQLTDEEIQNRISKYIENYTAEKNIYLTISQRVEIENKVYSLIKGLGILDDILHDDSVTEIMINGHKNIFIEKDGKIQPYDKHFESEDDLKSKIDKIVQSVSNREVNALNPVVDARLPDGSRVNVVISPIAIDGHTVTIRKFSKEPMTFEKLIRYGSITPQIASLLRDLVEARYNIFISGGTGSGKTTFLNALSQCIPAKERIITIEDSAELQITTVPNIVRLETRNANTSGEGAIDIKQLIRSSLRMRPDRIVVGECRGGETLYMLQAMNTGHDGSLSTGHANTAEDMLSRLETMVLEGSRDLPLPAIRKQIVSAIDIIIHLSRIYDSSRKTMSISEVKGIDKDGNVELNTLFQYEMDEEKSTSDKAVGKLVRTKNKLIRTEKLKAARKDIGIFDEKHYL